MDPPSISNSRAFRIALTADPELPVPPRLYGGIERIVDLLAHGLVARGHEVTLFAHPDSRSAGDLRPWPGRSSLSHIDTARNAAALTQGVVGRRFDLIHSFSRIAYLAPLLPVGIPKLMTYQRQVNSSTISAARRLSLGTLEFSAISNWMMREVAHIGPWHMVPNGVSLKTYQFAPKVTPDAPLVFLGRIEEIKGPHLAIEIAKRTGRNLVIAGNVPEEHRAWFDARVAPHIDQAQIRYLGPVDDQAKNQLLGSAFGFLMPILWDEPFGIVMAEALACGTPVLGLRRGAVPEIVVDGVTGFVREDLAGLVEAVEGLPDLSRAACRKRAETFYSADAVVEGYLRVYADMVGRQDR